jgi:tripartite-type tricarboxylate transporter receptor subunit TctC
MNRRRFIVYLALAACTHLGPARAEDWPARPVTLVHTFAAGGSGDYLARVVAKALSAKLGQTFTVEVRAGAGGIIGTVSAANAAPDGYTLLNTAIGPAVLNQLLLKSIPYDTEKDFTPVILVGETPQVIVSSPKFGFNTLQDLIEFGRKNPGKLNIGHPGAGSMGHLTAALFLARTGINGTLVGYRGAAPMLLDVLGGQIQAGLPAYTTATAGTTILAVTSAQRVSFLPDVPTAREGGVDLIAATWTAILAPAKTPHAIVMKLNKAINEYLASPKGKQEFATAGIRPLGGTPEHLAQVIKDERAMWAPIIAKEHIKLDSN